MNLWPLTICTVSFCLDYIRNSPSPGQTGKLQHFRCPPNALALHRIRLFPWSVHHTLCFLCHGICPFAFVPTVHTRFLHMGPTKLSLRYLGGAGFLLPTGVLIALFLLISKCRSTFWGCVTVLQMEIPSPSHVADGCAQWMDLLGFALLSHG